MFIDYYYKLIHNSVCQAANMGPNFRPINNYFALLPINQPENNIIIKNAHNFPITFTVA